MTTKKSVRKMNTPLFVYGTLRQSTLQQSRLPAAVAEAVSRMRLIGPGKLHGELVHLSHYPAARFHSRAVSRAKDLKDVNNTDQWVFGEIYSLPDAATLRVLDSWEEFNPSNPKASLYLRKRKRVTLVPTGKERLCWVYEYNGKL